jgi:hypothetical protein
MPERRCLFCGAPFTGQSHNFEHVIPRWLVREADLTKRTAPIDFPTKKFGAAMSRIGGRACEKCNEDSSDLEGRARIAYVKIRDGDELSAADARALLDWLDKLRVGMWLWTVDIGKTDYGVVPKFRINARMAQQDRLVLVARYPSDATGKGLGIWGATEYFVWSPSVMGFFINNIALISISANLLITRHMRTLNLRRYIHETGDEEMDVSAGDAPGKRLAFFGATCILGQVILPVEMFDELSLEMAQKSLLHTDFGEGPVFRLDGKLQEAARSPGSVPPFKGSVEAHIELMQMYVDKTAKYLLEDLLDADFSRIKTSNWREGIQAYIRDQLAKTDVDLDRLAVTYERLTGLKLPT